MEAKTIWITGANGFVGTYLCRHLRGQGHQITGLANVDEMVVIAPE